MSGRFIGENIRFMYDLFQTAKHDNIPGLLLSIDFQKAYVSVSHHFLNKVIRNFNFGPPVQKKIKLFYSQAKALVLVNVVVFFVFVLSEAFEVGRGCRQGDGLNPYLLLLCAEVLNMMVRNNQHIKGIKVINIEYCLSQYAHDTVIFLDGSVDSMNANFNVLESFAKISGLKVNIEKNKEEETLIHLFCLCPIIVMFWNKVAQWLRELSSIHIQIDEELCLFGVRSFTFSALSTIILISRFHIYKM